MIKPSRSKAPKTPKADGVETPLRPQIFALLAELAEQPRHGYALMREVNLAIGPHAVLGPGTLYRVLKELRDQGLIEPAPTPDDPSVDQRRRYYTLTELGRLVVTREAERVGQLVDQVRKSLPAGGAAR